MKNGHMGRSVRARQALVILILATLAGCGGGESDDDDFPDIPVTTSTVTASLDAKQVISGLAAPVSATANANFTVRSGAETDVSGSVTFSGFEPTSVAIHAGFAGEEGPAIISLTGSGGTTWTLPLTALDPDEAQRLDVTGYYLDATGPDGRLRGQVVPDGWVVEIFDLSGDQRIPAVDTAANGRGGIAINRTTGAYRLRITTDATTVTGAGIHEGFAGAQGPFLFELDQSLAQPNVWGSIDINDQTLFSRLNGAGIDVFGSGALHVKVSTVAAPDGELRGQILPPEADVHFSELTAAEVVLDNGEFLVTEDRAMAVTTFNTDTNEIAINVHTGAGDICCVELREGRFGENGPLVDVLTANPQSPDTWSLPLQALADNQQTALLDQGLHLVASSTAAPTGLARAQLIVGGTAAETAITVGKNGGQLALVDPAGATFTLTLPVDSVFESTAVSMARADQIPGLPAGVRVLAAVELGPEGATFAAAPRLTIDGTTAPGQGGIRLGYIVSADGSSAHFRPLSGEDPIAAARETRSHELLVPHFSFAALVEVDPEDGPLPEQSNPIPEDQAVAELAELVRQGVLNGGGIDQEAADSILGDWRASIEARAAALGSTGLESFTNLSEEYLRWQQNAQQYGSESIDTSALDQSLFETLSLALSALDSQCDGAAFDTMMSWFAPLERLYGGSPPENITRLQVNCLVTVNISPRGPLAAIRGAPNILITATVTSADGRDVGDNARLGFAWRSVMGQNVAGGTTIGLDASRVGQRQAEVVFRYFSISGDRDTAAVIVPDFRGSRSISISGGNASGCEDPEDNGPGSGSGFANIDTEIVEPLSDTAAGVRLIGTGSALSATITTISAEVTFDNNTVGTARGTAGGSANFTITEVDEETGEPVTTTGSVNLFGGTASGTSLNFPNASGNDSSGCSLSGSVSLF